LYILSVYIKAVNRHFVNNESDVRWTRRKSVLSSEEKPRDEKFPKFMRR